MEIDQMKSGDKAPLFLVEDIKGNRVDIQNYKGKRILLCFFRDASCPFCNLRVQQLIKSNAKFENQNIQILAFFASSTETINKFAGKQNAPFPLIADPDLKVYQMYKVGKSFRAKLKTMFRIKKVAGVMKSEFFNLNSFRTENIVPAEFLISEKHVIERAYYGKDFTDHISLDEIIKNELKH